MRTRYFWRDGCFRDRDGNPMDMPERDGPCMPMVQSDVPEYASPIDGKPITSRTHQREDLKRNGCVIKDWTSPKFDREEYKHRKAEQAKQLAERKKKLQ